MSLLQPWTRLYNPNQPNRTNLTMSEMESEYPEHGNILHDPGMIASPTGLRARDSWEMENFRKKEKPMLYYILIAPIDPTTMVRTAAWKKLSRKAMPQQEAIAEMRAQRLLDQQLPQGHYAYRVVPKSKLVKKSAKKPAKQPIQINDDKNVDTSSW